MSWNPKWEKVVERVKNEWAEFEMGFKEDEDLKGVKVANAKLGEDLKNGLRERVSG